MNQFARFTLLAVFVLSFLISNKLYTPNMSSNNSTKLTLSKKDLVKSNKDPKNIFSERKKKVKGYDKFDSPDKFAEVHRMIRTADDETEPSYPNGYRIKELTKLKTKAGSLSKTGNRIMADLDWVERGPANVGGRTRGILVDPNDPDKNTWIVGSVGGGVWKTTDAGETWTHLTKELPNLSTSHLAMAASNPDIIYVGTGEGFFNADAVEGEGIFKTTDGGVTWTQLEATVSSGEFNYVNRLLVDPSDENVVVVVTNEGIYRTDDGGVTFTRVKSSDNRVQDLRANPENFNTLYASVESEGVLISRDAGVTWREPLGENISGGRAEIAVSPVDTSRLYASVDGSTSRLFVSVDAGENWIESLEEVWDDWNEDGEEGDEYLWLGAQGWYDNTIEAHPYDVDKVFFGGIDLWKSEVRLDSINGIKAVELENIEDVFGFIPSGLPFVEGSVGSGNDYWGEDIIQPDDLVSIEIRFGSGVTQKAHRFTDENDYADYIDVPFEVWDIDNNKQIMASFNDRRKNGEFDLSALRGDAIFVNIVDYDENNPSADIAQEGGLKFKNALAWQLRNAPGVSFDPENFPEAVLRVVVDKLTILFRDTEPIVDGYNQYSGSQPDIHVDQHNLVMVPLDDASQTFRIINGNDGGVSVSDDNGVTWRETDHNGYNTTQFYGIDKKTGASEYFGGTQDNGTWRSPDGETASAETDYVYEIGGDGFETAWHATDPLKMIGGSQFNTLRRSTNGGENWARADNGFPDNGNSANSPFISKIASSKIDPDLVFTISSQGVWRSDNFAESWTLTPIVNSYGGGGVSTFSQITISVADPRIVWAGMYMNGTGVPHVSKDGGITFTPTNLYNDVILGSLSGLDTHPTEPGTAYATFSFSGRPKILRTTDFGNSWEDITGFEAGGESTNGFPNVATYCVAVMPFNTDIIWAGTDIGLIESVDGGASWHYADNGLPAVSIWEMKIIDDEVVVGTHGRGIWSVSLPELAAYNYPQLPLVPRINGDVIQLGAGLGVSMSLRSAYDSTQVIVGDGSVRTIFNNSPLDTSIIVPINGSGLIKVQLKSFVNDEIYLSYPKEVETIELLAASGGYYTTFESNTDDWINDGFEFSKPAGFAGPAAHTPHPYPDESELSLLLRTPIIVAGSDAVLKYEDIAIIETGEPGTVYGDEEFWDYVIVEGNSSGEWIELVDGYDADANRQWRDAYNAGGSGTESMYVEHSINLLDFFNEGDEVLIRFRLYADQFTNGWGWAINYVEIQPQFVGVEDEALPLTYSLKQNYPNPFNPSTTISYSLAGQSKVNLSVYNSIGERVTVLVNDVKAAGNYNVSWNAASLASGVYFYRIETDSFVDIKKMILLK